MIYTCLMNPSVDYTLLMNNPLSLGKINRCTRSSLVVGGKAFNVSYILDQLEVDSTLLAFLGGYTGAAIEKEIEKYEHIQLVRFDIESENRINVKIRDGKETDINLNGPVISEDAQRKMLLYIKEHCAEKDYVCICGSLASGMNKGFVYQLAQIVHEKKAYLVLDCANLTLDDISICEPYLIKPNLEELQNLFKRKISLDYLDIVAEGLKKVGVQNVFISLGKQGAYFKGENTYRVTCDNANVVNSVGAGDSSLAGFLAAESTGKSEKIALHLACAAGSATVTQLALANRFAITQMLKKIHVQQINGAE